MAYFPQVYKGQQFQPSVLEENNIRQGLNPAHSFNDPGTSRGNNSNIVVNVYNAGEETIEWKSAVVISPDHPVAGDIFPCVPYTGNQKKWGILLSNLEPGEVGSYLVSGVVDVDCSANGEFVMPDVKNPGKYSPAASGATVIAYDSENKIAKIALGVGSGEEYNGFFKVSINNEQIVVYDGEQPDSEYAGYIDLPQFDGVKKTFLPYPSTDVDRYVYLHACYNSEKGYFVTITFARSYVSDSFWYTTLAAVSNSTPVRQIFNSNDMISLSKDFYL